MATDAQRQDQTAQLPLGASISVVAPAYNEVGNIEGLTNECLDALDSTGRPYEIVFVNDGSDDATKDVIDRLSRKYPPIKALHLSRNFGQSAALQAGIDEAIGEIVVTIDADGQNDPADIPRLVNRLESEGVACVSGRRENRQDPLAKRVPSKIQTRLAEQTCPGIRDFGCTLKAYRAQALNSIQLHGEGHRYIPAKLYDKGFEVAELPVNHRPRENGDSKYGIGRLLRGFVDLLFTAFWNRYSARPMHLFGGIGVVCLLLGIAIGGVSVLQKYALGVPLGPRMPRLVLVALLVLFGVQLLIFGVLAELIQRLHYKDEQPYRVDRVVE